MAKAIQGEDRVGAGKWWVGIGLGMLALALTGPALAAGKPAKPSSLVREGYGDYGGGEVRRGEAGDDPTPSTSLAPDPSAPGGYRLQLEEPGVTDLPGQAPSVIPDPSAPGGYRYQPGVLRDPYAPPGQAPRVAPDPDAPGGYRINLLPGEPDIFNQPANQPATPSAPPISPDTGLLPQFQWPGEDPAYRQRQEQRGQAERDAASQERRYPWEPYRDRRSLRYRDQRQQEREASQD